MMATTYATTTGAALSGYASAPTTASHGFAVPGNAVEVAYLVHVNDNTSDAVTAVPYYYDGASWQKGAQTTLNNSKGFVVVQGCYGTRLHLHCTATSGSITSVTYSVRMLRR